MDVGERLQSLRTRKGLS
ncbi:hypothetical protein, partial [Pseudomonas cyclaminis]